MTRRRWLTLLVVLLMLPAIAACGRKASLDPPPGEKSEYPRTYPTQ